MYPALKRLSAYPTITVNDSQWCRFEDYGSFLKACRYIQGWRVVPHMHGLGQV